MKKLIMSVMLTFLCADVAIFAQEANAVLADESGLVSKPAAEHEQIPSVELDNLAAEAAEAAETEQIPPVELDNNFIETVNAAPSVEDVPPAPSAAVKPKIAVYVTGGKDVGENKALGTYILDALAASSRYTTIERSEAFLAEIDNEQIAQRSGAVDDSQISRLGKQSGVQFVCVADITQALRGSQISARILDVETAEVVTVGVSTSPLKTMDDLRKVSAAIVEAMFRKLYPDEYKTVPIPEKKLMFGVRVAYNNSFVSKMNVTIRTVGSGGMPVNEKYYGKVGVGSGFEAGAVTLVGLTDALAFNFSPSVIIRTPFVSDAAEISEMAVSVPALFEWRLAKSPVRVLCGVQFEIPFDVKIKWEGEEAVDFGEYGKRAGMDFSVVAGGSIRIMRNLAADVRGSIGLREFESETNGFLNQLSLGVSYLY